MEGVENRCGANVAHMRQSRLDPGLGFKKKAARYGRLQGDSGIFQGTLEVPSAYLTQCIN